MSDDISIPQAGAMPRMSFSHSYRTRRTGMDQTTKRLLIAAGVLGLLLVGGMSTWVVMGRRPATVPVIEADSRPLRVKPDNPGGMQIAGADEVVMGGNGRAGTDTMAPAAEAPAPQALRAQMKQPSAPGPDAASVAPAAGTGPAVVASAPAMPVPAGAGTAVSPLPDTPTRGAARMAAPTPAAPATTASATTALAASARAATGAMQVQLAAMGSEAAAQAEWQRLAKQMPDLLGTRHPVVLRAERDGKTIWRVRTGGFADVADATGFCGRVRAKGGACSIASF
ncbi:MAG: hypothetical protein NVSMB18_19380 [Acetobacteraceae bacterium]